MPQPPSLPASGFVTATAKVSLLMAGLGLAWSVFQLLVAALLPDDAVAAMDALPEVPAALVWCLEHRLGLSLLVLALSVLFLACSWGLLRRREWARIGFIVFLVLGAVLNLAGLALIDHVFDTLQAMLPVQILDSGEGRQLLAQLQVSRTLAWASGVLGVIAFGALHGWIIYRLAAAPVRREFSPGSP